MDFYFCTECNRDHFLDSALFSVHKIYAEKPVRAIPAIVALAAALTLGMIAGAFIGCQAVRAKRNLAQQSFNALPDYVQPGELAKCWTKENTL